MLVRVCLPAFRLQYTTFGRSPQVVWHIFRELESLLYVSVGCRLDYKASNYTRSFKQFFWIFLGKFAKLCCRM